MFNVGNPLKLGNISEHTVETVGVWHLLLIRRKQENEMIYLDAQKFLVLPWVSLEGQMVPLTQSAAVVDWRIFWAPRCPSWEGFGGNALLSDSQCSVWFLVHSGSTDKPTLPPKTYGKQKFQRTAFLMYNLLWNFMLSYCISFLKNAGHHTLYPFMACWWTAACGVRQNSPEE